MAETLREQFEERRTIASSFLQAAEELHAQGETDAAESLWEDVINLTPSIIFEHLGFKGRGAKLRLAYAIGLAEFFPQTEKEKAALHRPMQINPGFFLKI